MSGTCPNTPTPPPSCGRKPCENAMPFDAATGAVEQSFSFMSTNHGSTDLTWYNLYETGGNPDNPDRGLGPNWSMSQFAELTDHNDGTVSVMFAPGRDCGNGPDGPGGGCNTGGGIRANDVVGSYFSNMYWFAESSTAGTYTGCFGCLASLTQIPATAESGTPPDDWRLVEVDGTVTVFDGTNGLIKSRTTPGGQVTEFSYSTTTPVRIDEMRRTFEYGTNDVTIESRLYEYDNDDALQYITLRRTDDDSSDPDWTEIRRTELVYYASDEASKGTDGDLKLIKQQLPGTISGTWTDDKITLFRYYTENESDGFQHGLKYVLSPEGYERLNDVPGETPETASNTVLAPFVSVYYEYDSKRRVKTVSTEGGLVSDTIAFSENKSLANYDYNNWLRKCVITRPDGLVKTVYSNHIGQDLLVDDKDGNDHWITNWKYNVDGRLEQMVHPSAIDMSSAPYKETEDDLDVKINSVGLIDVYDYYSSDGSGGANGYLKSVSVQQGDNGTPIKVREIEYFNQVVDSGTATETKLNPVSKTTNYQSDTGSGDPVSTTTIFTWFTDSVQIEIATSTLPEILAGENPVGTTSNDTIVNEYDIQGRLIEKTDARGNKTTYSYDEVTGSMIQMVQDSGTGGLQLTTDMTNDDLGRQTEALGPGHNVNGNTVRSATWTVYKDDADAIWRGRGYETDGGGTPTYTLVNPVTIDNMDKNGRVIESIQATRGSGVEDSGKLVESNTFPQTSWVRWTVNNYGNGGRMNSKQVYFSIPSPGGVIPAGYDETEFAYDSVGRPNVQTTPAGTITRTVYDVRGLTQSVWVGTNDKDATDSDPSGRDALDNNMKAITENEYDDDADGGDGNLTKVTRPVSDANANDRVTEMEYDWRDRLDTTIIDDGTNKYQTVATLDNLGRTTASETKRGTSTPVLIKKSETNFDTRNRVYRTKVFAVNDSGNPGNDLESNTWFNASNNVIKSKPAGSEAFTKTTFDAVNRPTNNYLGYYDGTGTDDPETLIDNMIFEESSAEYDDASNAIFVTTKMRNHDATGTGALNGPSGSEPKSRDSFMAYWFDGIGRNTDVANYGTFAGTVPNPPASPFASSDNILVSNTIYNADGEVKDVVDPAGKIDRTLYDDAGRVVKVTNNQDGSDTEVTNTEYDNGRISKLSAENSTTGTQDTTYTFGVTLTGSNIASNELAQKVTYPEGGEIEFDYNRQNQEIEMTDQNDTVHDYEYDKLGRKTEDRITLAAGSNVDDSVLRIEMSYDDRLRLEKSTSFDASTGGNVVNDVLMEYNDFDQLVKEYQEHGGVATGSSPNIQYTYENGSGNNTRMKSVTYPTATRVVDYDYGVSDSDDDQLSRVRDLKIGTLKVAGYRYLGTSQVVVQLYDEPTPDPVAFTLVTGTGNNPYASMDRFDRITNLVWQQGKTSKLIDYDYTYDRLGNKLTQTVNGSPAPTNVDELYGYDELYRLKAYDRGELVSGSITNPTLTQDWTLDQTGNWAAFSQGVVDAGVQSRTHSKANEISGITVTTGPSWDDPSYDGTGNMTETPIPNNLSSTFVLTWDAWNRLVKLKDGSDTVAEYEYDGMNRRIIKKKYNSGVLDETRHFYLSGQNQVLEERVNTETTAAQQYVWGIRYVDDLVLRDKDTNNNGTLDERLYALCDPRFSVLAVVDDTGAVQERYTYDGYGTTNVYTAAFVNRNTGSNFDWEFRYTGRRQDLESGIYYFRARYYHAQLGVFLSRDPLGYVNGLSFYRGYFIPNGKDPNGLFVEENPTILNPSGWCKLLCEWKMKEHEETTGESATAAMFIDCMVECEKNTPVCGYTHVYGIEYDGGEPPLTTCLAPSPGPKILRKIVLKIILKCGIQPKPLPPFAPPKGPAGNKKNCRCSCPLMGSPPAHCPNRYVYNFKGACTEAHHKAAFAAANRDAGNDGCNNPTKGYRIKHCHCIDVR